MTWNGHIKQISNNISRYLRIMNRLKRYLPPNILRTIYNSLILPHINDSILVWGFKSSRISNLKKKAVRMIYCNKYDVHTEPLYKSLNLFNVEDILKIKAFKLYYTYSQKKKHSHFISMKCSSKLLIDTIIKKRQESVQIRYKYPTRTDTGGKCTLHWRHHERDGVSNHQPHDCLLNLVFRRRSKNTSKPRVTGLCAGNSPVTREFPSQMASNAENLMTSSW